MLFLQRNYSLSIWPVVGVKVCFSAADNAQSSSFAAVLASHSPLTHLTLTSHSPHTHLTPTSLASHSPHTRLTLVSLTSLASLVWLAHACLTRLIRSYLPHTRLKLTSPASLVSLASLASCTIICVHVKPPAKTVQLSTPAGSVQPVFCVQKRSRLTLARALDTNGGLNSNYTNRYVRAVGILC